MYNMCVDWYDKVYLCIIHIQHMSPHYATRLASQT